MTKYICGRNSVLEAIENNLPIKRVIISEKMKNKNFENLGIKIEYMPLHKIDKLISANHQGYVAELKEFNYFNIDEIYKDKPEKVLVLDHIQDPYNFGAIIRTANASGIKHIIIPKDRSVSITPTVLKVASGGQVGIKIIRVDSLQSTLKKMKDNQFWIYATALDETAIEANDATFNYPMALIVGNEHKGVNKTLLKLSDQKIYINMKGTVQSLNVSVATGIMLFKI